MAGFPSNTGTIPLTLEQTFSQIRSLAGSVKTMATTLRNRSAAGDVHAPDITFYATSLGSQRVVIATLAATSGLQSYVQTQYPTVDITALYNTMVAQIDATVGWITTNYPKDGAGHLSERKWGSGGQVVNDVFTPASLATFRAQLDLLIATID